MERRIFQTRKKLVNKCLFCHFISLVLKDNFQKKNKFSETFYFTHMRELGKCKSNGTNVYGLKECRDEIANGDKNFSSA